MDPMDPEENEECPDWDHALPVDEARNKRVWRKFVWLLIEEDDPFGWYCLVKDLEEMLAEEEASPNT